MVSFVWSFGQSIVRPHDPLINPGAEQADLVGGERLAFAIRRHFGIGHEPRGEMDYPAFGTFARHNHWAVISPFESMFACVQQQPAFALVWTVTLQASAFD